jgi:glycosyltransferase involved in cell wall biosynthesis
MTPLRLLVILEARSITGPARNLLEYAPFARSAGIEITVATFLRKEVTNFFTETLKSLCIPVRALPEESAYDFSTLQGLKTLAKEVRADLIQTHAVKSHFLTRLSGLARSIPWVAFHHGYTATTWRTDLYNELDRWSLKAAAQVVTVSNALVEQLRSKGLNSKQIKVIHNAVPAAYSVDGAEAVQIAALKSSLGIPVGRQVILSVGRLSKEKDQVGIVEALSKLRGSSPYLLILGEGPERKTILDSARALGLIDRVVLAGHQDRVAPYYALADVVVISSRSEGSPNVLLEALAAGIPLVATAVGGIPEMVQDDEHALLVRHGDSKQMAECIDKILTTTDLAQKLVLNGKKLVQTKFSPAERARTLSEIYTSILTSWKQRGPTRGV